MGYTVATLALGHNGVRAMLSAAVAEAEAIRQPQCIVIVDSSGATMAEFRMTGAKFLSLTSARNKALTAASIRQEATAIPDEVRTQIGLATGGAVTGLPGGLPIRFDGVLVGGVGVGSGSGDQDIGVAMAALAAVGADI